MDKFPGYQEHYKAEARLIIVKALADETNYTMNDNLMCEVLKAFGIDKGRSFVKTQFNWLEENADAIRLKKNGTSVIASLTEDGLDHVEGRVVIDGIKRPSPLGA